MTERRVYRRCVSWERESETRKVPNGFQLLARGENIRGGCVGDFWALFGEELLVGGVSV